MTAIKVRADQFVGSGHLFTREPNGLAAILRGMLIDSARLKVEVAGVHDYTDNSTGTPAAALVAIPIPTISIDGTTMGGVTAAALNASLVKIQNAGLVITNTINEASALLGLPANVSVFGTQAAADTIPALDKTGTAGAGVAVSAFASAVAAFQITTSNLVRLVQGSNEVLRAIGVAPLSLRLFGRHALDLTLVAIPGTVIVAAGPGAVAKTDVDAFLLACANNIATLAAVWNTAMTQSVPGPLHAVAG
jgi:hypothetical protein